MICAHKAIHNCVHTALTLVPTKLFTWAATRAGACIMPFMPAFYSGETTLAGLMRHFAGRLLDQLHIPHTLCTRWRNNQ